MTKQPCMALSSGMGLSRLLQDELVEVLCSLESPYKVSLCREVCITWRNVASQDAVWQRMMRRHFAACRQPNTQSALFRFQRAFSQESVWLQDPNQMYLPKPHTLIAPRTRSRKDSQRVIQAHDNWVPSCMEWPEATSRISCSYDGTVKLVPLADRRFDNSTSQQIGQTQRFREGFIAMDIDRARGLVVAGSDAGTVYMYRCVIEAEKMVSVTQIPVESHVSQALGRPEMIQAILIDDGCVYCGCETGLIHMRRLPDTGTEGCGAAVEMDGHQDAVMTIKPMDGDQLASCSMDQSVVVWDKGTLQQVVKLDRAHERSVHSLDAVYGGSCFYTGSRDHLIKQWDRRAFGAQATLAGHQGSVTTISVNERFLLSGGGFNRHPGGVEVLSVDSTIRLWDLRMNKQMWSVRVEATSSAPHLGGWEFERDPVLCVKMLSNRCLSGHGDGTIRVLDFSTGPCELDDAQD